MQQIPCHYLKKRFYGKDIREIQTTVLAFQEYIGIWGREKRAQVIVVSVGKNEAKNNIAYT